MKPYNTRVIVLTPGKCVPLSEQPMPVKSVTVWAIPGNTTVVYIGSSTTRARVGEENAAPLNGGTRPDAFTWSDTDLSWWWIDAITANEGVTLLATF